MAGFEGSRDTVMDKILRQRLMSEAMFIKPELPLCVTNGIMSLPEFLQISGLYISNDISGMRHAARLSALRQWYLDSKGVTDLKKRLRPMELQQEPVQKPVENMIRKTLVDHVREEFLKFIRIVIDDLGYWPNRNGSKTFNVNKDGLDRISYIYGSEIIVIERSDGQSLEADTNYDKKYNYRDVKINHVAYRKSDLNSIIESKGCNINLKRQAMIIYNFGSEQYIKLQQKLEYGKLFTANTSAYYSEDGVLERVDLDGFVVEEKPATNTRLSVLRKRFDYNARYQFDQNNGYLNRYFITADNGMLPHLKIPETIGKGNTEDSLLLELKLKSRSACFGVEIPAYINHHELITQLFTGIIRLDR
ncbi:MAG: hypothetical protein ABIG89_07020 [Candidatus Woesearchaeota archaeon]